MSKENLLMVSDSDHDANMLYAVRMFIPDAFIYLRCGGKCHIVLSDMEIDRARKNARHCKVLSLSHYLNAVRKEGVKRPSLADVIKKLLREKGLKKVYVPANFSHGLAKQLSKLKIKVKVKDGQFFPERELKTREEVKKISAALMMAEVGLAEGIQAIKMAKIGKRGELLRNNVALTSEKLRAIIDTAIIQAGGLASHTIVAGGRQTCDPHEQGYGVIKAHEPIIIDVFPRSQKTGYFGDITRTVVKGKASEALRKVYHTVAQAQEIAFKVFCEGIQAAHVHKAVNNFFESEGYKTGRSAGRMQGFFHGTGHGVGLEIHEAPRVSATSTDVLRTGHVVTVEPGLYYPQIGGVRLEDMAFIAGKTAKNLTRFEKVLEL